jgi:hypothetical protein
MKKLIASLTLVSMAVMILGPALAFAVDPTVGTGLTRGAGGGSAPIVKVKWEMWDLGKDDSTDAGAQFLAPGVWNTKMNYKVCAIATDPNGVADIDGVYADIYYPADKAYQEDPAHLDSHPSVLPEVGIGACGAFIEENTLLPLSKADGYDLFCNKIKNNNNNLPTFNSGYNYAEICATDGELMKETAYVYCDPKTLKWEDPAGMYKVVVTAQDKAGNNSESGSLTNHFEYLPLTAFAKDFASISYGQVMLNSHQIVSGDLVFGSGDATIRNTGNTRLNMKVAQDDMGLGQSSGQWNVGFDGRVGNHANDWKNYCPFDYKGTGSPTAGEYTKLEDILELSETEEMDFSILVTKWPDANTSYGGTMWLDAVFAPFRICPK